MKNRNVDNYNTYLDSYSKTIKLLLLLRTLGFNLQILNEAKDKFTTKHTMSMFGTMLGMPYQNYPLTPTRSTWPDKAIMALSIMLAAGVIGLFILGVLKCSFLLYACL